MGNHRAPTVDEEFLAAHHAYADAIFRFCYLRIHERERALDLTQEIFTKAWEYLANGGAVTHLRAFLYRIAGNCIIDDSRKRKEASLDALQEQEFEPRSNTHIAEDADIRALIAKLAALTDEDRDILILRYIEGYSPQEIAEMLQTSANVISVRCFRAKRKARALFENVWPIPGITPQRASSAPTGNVSG